MFTRVQPESVTEMETSANIQAEQENWTDAEFRALSKDGHDYEIVAGKLVDIGNSGAKHGYVCSLFLAALVSYILPRNLGVVLDSSTAFKMKSGNKRSPDISFFARECLQGLKDLPDSFLDGAPDLAVEILSPGNTIEEIHDKLVEYFENGSRLVWVVHLTEQYVLVYRSARGPERLLKSTDTFDGEEIVPGFVLAVSDLFPKLAF